jgi:hypothetical protein
MLQNSKFSFSNENYINHEIPYHASKFHMTHFIAKCFVHKNVTCTVMQEVYLLLTIFKCHLIDALFLFYLGPTGG